MKVQMLATFVAAALVSAPVFAQDKKSMDTSVTTPAPAASTTDKKPSMGSRVKENVKDARITAKIKSEFAKDKEVSALKINVDTDNKGVVTLTGNVKSQAEIDKAVKIATATEGVASVNNNLKVREPKQKK